ncbi:MAG: TSUP family transporter [Oscillospiraceae bacterium]|nr:TSUP family transporter [Oscillospiraceae bacterium]
MEITWKTFAVVCPLIFLGGFMDAVAGGGGIITLPAYMFAGVPIHMAYGTNKFGNSFGTAIATFNYGRGGFIRWKPGFLCAAMSLIGSWLGALVVVALSEQALQYCTTILLPAVAIFMILNRNIGKKEKEEATGKKLYALSALIGLVIGMYDGFFGPGTGTFMVLAFTALLGYSLINASGNAKLVNLASNVGGLIAYIYHGNVLFLLGIPAAICSIAGNYLGTKMAIKIGGKFIRPVLLTAMGLLVVKLIFDILS